MIPLSNGLDRYVRRIFLGALTACLVIFSGLWMVADFFGKLDDIFELMQEYPEHNTLTVMAGLVGHYFLANLPFFLHHTAPFIPLIAALYAMNRLLRSNELTPMVVAGVSLFRILRPIFTWTAVFAFLVFLNQELILPRLALDQQHLGRRLKGRSSRELTKLPIISDRLGNRYIIDRYDPHPRRRIITRMVMVKTAHLDDGRLILERQVYAPAARFVDSTEKRRKGWILGDGSFEEVRQPSGTVVRRPLRFLTNATGSRLVPRDIEHAKLDQPALSIRDLRRMIRRQPDSSRVQELHRHFTHPLKCFLLLLLGLPFLMRAYVRQLTIAPILKCLVSCVVFYLFDFLCLDLGNRGTFHPAVAAWLPFVLFAAVAAVLLDKVRT